MHFAMRWLRNFNIDSFEAISETDCDIGTRLLGMGIRETRREDFAILRLREPNFGAIAVFLKNHLFLVFISI